jgi:hypothetical protein
MGVANPLLGVLGVTVAPGVSLLAQGIATNLASDLGQSAWDRCCKRIFADRGDTNQPLLRTLRSAFQEAIDQLEQELSPRSKSGLRFSRTSQDPAARAFYENLRKLASASFDSDDSERWQSEVLNELKKGPDNAWQLVHAYIDEAASSDDNLAKYFLPLVKTALPAHLSLQLERQLRQDNTSDTAAWREFQTEVFRIILDEFQTSNVLTQELHAESVLQIDKLIAECYEKSLQTWQNELALALADLNKSIEQIPDVTATKVLNGMEAVLNEYMSPQRPSTTSLTNIPYPKSRYFVGRHNDLDRLRNQFTATDEPIALVQAIQGLGGVGKTQLAVHYAHDYADHYDGIWWIRSESIITMLADFGELGRQLRLPLDESSTQLAWAKEAQQYLQGTNDQWLLIFDNAVPETATSDLNSLLPKRGHCHILITSRVRDWAHIAIPQDVDVLSPEAATRFLLDRTGSTDADAAIALAEELGRLPLALEQAGAFIVAQQGQETLASYLDRFRRHPLPRLAEDRARIGNYNDVVATTWFISFDAVQQLNPSSNELLQLVAFFAPEQIPIDLVVQYASLLPANLAMALSTPDRARDLIGHLLRYSIVDSAGFFTIDVHRLVQLVVREWLSQSEWETWATAATQILASELHTPILTWITVDEQPKYELLIPHSLACISCVDKGERYSPELAMLLLSVGHYMRDRSYHLDAISYLSRAIEIAEHLFEPTDRSLAFFMPNAPSPI